MEKLKQKPLCTEETATTRVLGVSPRGKAEALSEVLYFKESSGYARSTDRLRPLTAGVSDVWAYLSGADFVGVPFWTCLNVKASQRETKPRKLTHLNLLCDAKPFLFPATLCDTEQKPYTT